MRGSIKKRYRSSWTIVLDTGKDPTTGKRRQQSITVKGSKREAEHRLAELLHQANTGSLVRRSKLTVGEFLDQWLQDYAASQVRPNTLESYRGRAKHLIKSLGQIALIDLRPEDLQGYYA